MDGFQVFGRHDILIIHFQFEVRLFVFHDIAASANLHTRPAVGGVVEVIQA